MFNLEKGFIKGDIRASVVLNPFKISIYRMFFIKFCSFDINIVLQNNIFHQVQFYRASGTPNFFCQKYIFREIWFLNKHVLGMKPRNIEGSLYCKCLFSWNRLKNSKI